jgi:signal peptidase I
LLDKDKEERRRKKNYLHIRISREVLIILVIGVCIIGVWFGLKVILHVDNPFYVVSSESMTPSLMVGDIVVIRDGPEFSFYNLKVGDIIVFHTNDAGGRTIVHRLVEIYSDNKGGEKLVKTKGDNNPISYENFDYPIREQDYYGKVIYVIPTVGLISVPPSSYVISATAISLVSATLLIGIIYAKKKKNKQRAENNEKI